MMRIRPLATGHCPAAGRQSLAPPPYQLISCSSSGLFREVFAHADPRQSRSEKLWRAGAAVWIKAHPANVTQSFQPFNRSAPFKTLQNKVRSVDEVTTSGVDCSIAAFTNYCGPFKMSVLGLSPLGFLAFAAVGFGEFGDMHPTFSFRRLEHNTHPGA